MFRPFFFYVTNLASLLAEDGQSLAAQIEGHGGKSPAAHFEPPFTNFANYRANLQSPFSASSSSLMKRLRRSRVVSSNGCAAILRACARRRSSSCRLVVSVSMPGNAAHCFRFRQCSGNCSCP
jgi:hypothetical protein